MKGIEFVGTGIGVLIGEGIVVMIAYRFGWRMQKVKT
jgi:hypothetical protein